MQLTSPGKAAGKLDVGMSAESSKATCKMSAGVAQAGVTEAAACGSSTCNHDAALPANNSQGECVKHPCRIEIAARVAAAETDSPSAGMPVGSSHVACACEGCDDSEVCASSRMEADDDFTTVQASNGQVGLVVCIDMMRARCWQHACPMCLLTHQNCMFNSAMVVYQDNSWACNIC